MHLAPESGDVVYPGVSTAVHESDKHDGVSVAVQRGGPRAGDGVSAAGHESDKHDGVSVAVHESDARERHARER